MGKIIDLVGLRIGRLTVKSIAGKNKYHAVLWECLCDCGKIHIVQSQTLRRGETKSCGCWKSEQASTINRSHGLSMRDGKFTYTFRIWVGMRSRCLNPKAPFFNRYGGAGIGICRRWDNYENFLADMGEAVRGMSIDRIDAASDYSPSNCRWASAGDQAKNRRTPRNNTSGAKNVIFRKGKWLVSVGVNKKKLHFGSYDDFELAELVAFEARRKFHGNYANHC